MRARRGVASAVALLLVVSLAACLGPTDRLTLSRLRDRPGVIGVSSSCDLTCGVYIDVRRDLTRRQVGVLVADAVRVRARDVTLRAGGRGGGASIEIEGRVDTDAGRTVADVFHAALDAPRPEFTSVGWFENGRELDVEVYGVSTDGLVSSRRVAARARSVWSMLRGTPAELRVSGSSKDSDSVDGRVVVTGSRFPTRALAVLDRIDRDSRPWTFDVSRDHVRVAALDVDSVDELDRAARRRSAGTGVTVSVELTSRMFTTEDDGAEDPDDPEVRRDEQARRDLGRALGRHMDLTLAVTVKGDGLEITRYDSTDEVVRAVTMARREEPAAARRVPLLVELDSLFSRVQLGTTGDASLIRLGALITRTGPSRASVAAPGTIGDDEATKAGDEPRLTLEYDEGRLLPRVERLSRLMSRWDGDADAAVLELSIDTADRVERSTFKVRRVGRAWRIVDDPVTDGLTPGIRRAWKRANGS